MVDWSNATLSPPTEEATRELPPLPTAIIGGKPTPLERTEEPALVRGGAHRSPWPSRNIVDRGSVKSDAALAHRGATRARTGAWRSGRSSPWPKSPPRGTTCSSSSRTLPSATAASSARPTNLRCITRPVSFKIELWASVSTGLALTFGHSPHRARLHDISKARLQTPTTACIRAFEREGGFSYRHARRTVDDARGLDERDMYHGQNEGAVDQRRARKDQRVQPWRNGVHISRSCGMT